MTRTDPASALQRRRGEATGDPFPGAVTAARRSLGCSSQHPTVLPAGNQKDSGAGVGQTLVVFSHGWSVLGKGIGVKRVTRWKHGQRDLWERTLFQALKTPVYGQHL